MDPSHQSQLLKRINELVFDEEKIVTCLSASSELNISLDDAKNLMEIFVEKYKPDSEKLGISYLLCGTLKENKGVAVYLVEERNLKSQEDLFFNISRKITYSIQKSEDIDFNMIALTNSTHDKYVGYFVSKNCVKRTLKNKFQPPGSANGGVKHAKNTNIFNNVKSKSANEENIKNTTVDSQKPTKPRQNGGIASFFAKANSKVDGNCKKVEKMDTNTKSVKEEVPEKSKLLIGENTMEKQVQKMDTNAKSVKEEIPEKSKLINGETEQKSEELKTNSNEDSSANSEEIAVKTKPNEINKKKRKKESKTSNPNKKRKRIQEICDSDSDDIFDDDDEEDVIEKSEDEPEPVAVKIQSPPKTKRRKAVDRTFVDEEGFLVTTTEYILEEVLAEESEKTKEKTHQKENERTKSNSQQQQKTAIGTVKPVASKGKMNKKQNTGKQATLTSFFKKN